MSLPAAETIAAEARLESPLWARALRDAPEWEPVFSPLVPQRFELGLETVYEAYLVHYGKPRLFDPADESERILLGDYLYAHGLVRIADRHVVQAVADLAELLSICAQVRAEGRSDDGPAWAASAAGLGAGVLDDARAVFREDANSVPLLALAHETAGEGAVDEALRAHLVRVG